MSCIVKLNSLPNKTREIYYFEMATTEAKSIITYWIGH